MFLFLLIKNIYSKLFRIDGNLSSKYLYWRGARLLSAQVFLTAETEGHTMSLLDIGGGFMGGKESTLDEASELINAALDEHFPEVRNYAIDYITKPSIRYPQMGN